MLEKVLTVLGRAFIAAGVLVFLFVAFQLWGTNITEARHQAKLKVDAEKEFAAAAAKTNNSASSSNTSSTTAAPGNPGQAAAPSAATNSIPAPAPAPTGAAVAVIKIPAINLQQAVVEGTGVPDLKKGPGHYVSTPLPGQPGNAAIAGHRTTYGAPFGDLGELKVGDEINVTTKQGSFIYKMTGSKVVDPSDNTVLQPTNDNRLTLTTCNPKYSAAQRLVIMAALTSDPALAPVNSSAAAAPSTPATTAAPGQTTVPGQTTTSATATTTAAPQVAGEEAASVSGTATSKTPAFIWGFVCILVALAAWVASRLWKRWPSYIIGSVVFLVVLFFFFDNFSRLLPANA